MHCAGAPIGRRPLCQNATQADGILRFGTRPERTAPESAVEPCAPVFTARCRLGSDPAHHIQHDRDGPQHAADDKG
jgi:hypothetical protein